MGDDCVPAQGERLRQVCNTYLARIDEPQQLGALPGPEHDLGARRPSVSQARE